MFHHSVVPSPSRIAALAVAALSLTAIPDFSTIAHAESTIATGSLCSSVLGPLAAKIDARIETLKTIAESRRIPTFRKKSLVDREVKHAYEGLALASPVLTQSCTDSLHASIGAIRADLLAKIASAPKGGM